MNRIRDDIKKREFHNLYLLYGDEEYLKRYYRENLKYCILEDSDDMNFSKFENKGIDLNEVQSIADTLPFFSEHRLIIIQDSGLFKSSNDFADYLEHMPDSTIIVFVEKEIDKRNKLYKYINKNGIAAEIKVKDSEEVLNWAAKRLKESGKVFTRKTMEYFLHRVDNNLYNLSNEIEKIAAYTAGREEITIADIDAVCPAYLQNHIFQMVDAVGAGDTDKALKLYNELIELKEAPSYILYMLIRHFNILLQIGSMGNAPKNQVASKIGISPYFVGNYQRQSSRFSGKQLKQALDNSLETEQKFKTGVLDDQIGVELLLIELIRM